MPPRVPTIPVSPKAPPPSLPPARPASLLTTTNKRPSESQLTTERLPIEPVQKAVDSSQTDCPGKKRRIKRKGKDQPYLHMKVEEAKGAFAKGPKTEKWIQAKDCVALWDTFEEINKELWPKCERCKVNKSQECENIGLYTPGPTGERREFVETLPSPLPEELPKLPDTLSPSQRTALAHVFKFARPILEWVKPPTRHLFNTSEIKSRKAIELSEVRRCDECKKDIFPVGVRCERCKTDWCKECFEKGCQKPLHGGTTPDHCAVALTFLHHDTTSQLLSLSRHFDDSLLRRPHKPPPLEPFEEIPQLPAGHSYRRILRKLKDSKTAQLVRILDPQAEPQLDLKEEIERHIALGKPLAVKRKIGQDWELDGKLWEEMKSEEATWEEVTTKKGVKEPEPVKKVGTIESFLERIGKKFHCYLQDFPREKRFSDCFPQTFKAFEALLPHPELMTHDGAFNLGSTLYQILFAPDLGPKGYFADVLENTKPHADASDAGNIALTLLSNDSKYKNKPVAIWLLFDADDYDTVSDVLRSENDDFPLQSFTTSFSESHLDELARRNVQIQILFQELGTMVIIPAGCAHEVINIAPVAKLAVDFIPPASLDRCIKVQGDRVKYYGTDSNFVGKGDLIRAPARAISFLIASLAPSRK